MNASKPVPRFSHSPPAPSQSPTRTLYHSWWLRLLLFRLRCSQLAGLNWLPPKVCKFSSLEDTHVCAMMYILCTLTTNTCVVLIGDFPRIICRYFCVTTCLSLCWYWCDVVLLGCYAFGCSFHPQFPCCKCNWKLICRMLTAAL